MLQTINQLPFQTTVKRGTRTIRDNKEDSDLVRLKRDIRIRHQRGPKITKRRDPTKKMVGNLTSLLKGQKIGAGEQRVFELTGSEIKNFNRESGVFVRRGRLRERNILREKRRVEREVVREAVRAARAAAIALGPMDRRALGRRPRPVRLGLSIQEQKKRFGRRGDVIRAREAREAAEAEAAERPRGAELAE